MYEQCFKLDLEKLEERRRGKGCERWVDEKYGMENEGLYRQSDSEVRLFVDHKSI